MSKDKHRNRTTRERGHEPMAMSEHLQNNQVETMLGIERKVERERKREREKKNKS